MPEDKDSVDQMEEDLQALCQKNGIRQAILFYRDEDTIRIRGMADNPIDAAAVKAFVEGVEEHLPLISVSVEKSMYEATAKETGANN